MLDSFPISYLPPMTVPSFTCVPTNPATTWPGCVAVAAMLLASPALAADAPLDYERDVAPIFEANCLDCHAADYSESGFRLDGRAYLLRGGDSGLPAIVPGSPEKSYLMEVINHVDPDMAMPPDSDKIAAADIATIERWIREGAVWPGQMDAVIELESDHWAFQPVERPDVPNASDASPIDAFLQAKLAADGLDFSEPAEPRALIRRVSIVLTGLPPTPDQTEAFVAASATDADAAYAALVDRLLASPHFGERWAQHWLDVIRWAETNGSEANLYRKNAWRYRDYVVDAFNSDLPYDRFVREQIAGDTLGAGEATGFLVAGPHVPAATVGREPTAIRQARADRMDEIMQTVGASVMGLTVGCARCHNHKFDPLTITDYYAMTGVFADVEFGSRRPEYRDDHPRQTAARDIRAEIAAERARLRELGAWEEDWGAFRELHFRPVTTDAVRIRFKQPYVGVDELEILTADADGQIANVAAAEAGGAVNGFPADGKDGRFPIERLIDGEYGTMNWQAALPKDGDDRPWAVLTFDGERTVSRLRISNNREYFTDTDYLTSMPRLPRYEFDLDVRVGEEDGDEAWQPWVGTWHANRRLAELHPERKAILDRIRELIDELQAGGPQPSFVGRLIEPPTTYVLHRGSPESPRDAVDPAGPAIFGGDLELDSDAAGPDRRLAFADWITDPDHPLTARVAANRLWHHTFGRGLVPTTSDFGEAGMRPSHPELLDWLAAEFVAPSDAAEPWSMKAMIRRLVMSRAFRQSSRPRAEALAIDGDAALLWRFPPKRVEAEVIRDAVLQAAGNLDRSIGGPSFRIHNEKKTYAQWKVVDNHGPDTWRRMLYQERMRRVDDGLFTAFDFPDCGQVRAKRPVSTTPLQALNLMNSAFVVEQSEAIAARATKNAADEAAAVDRCFALLLGRAPSADERDACVELAQADSLAAVCRALINTNEFAFLP